jgi:hypothetical protein
VGHHVVTDPVSIRPLAGQRFAVRVSPDAAHLDLDTPVDPKAGEQRPRVTRLAFQDLGEAQMGDVRRLFVPGPVDTGDLGLADQFGLPEKLFLR